MPSPDTSGHRSSLAMPAEISAQDVAALVAFNHVSGIGPRRMAVLVGTFGSARAAWEAPGAQLAAVLDRRSYESLAEARRRLDPPALLSRVAAEGMAVVTTGHADYPAQLAAIANPPFVLYVRGNAALLAARAVAVVGTRRASDYGLRAAAQLAGDLARQGLTIVSGLALGVDTAAHQAALDSGGTTIAVLGSGLDAPYPAQNRRLFERIATDSLAVSEVPPGSRPEPGNFPARNRIISGLSLGVVVVEAGLKSGALITAECALEQGREVWAVPGTIFSARSEGTNALLVAGAAPALRVADILESLAGSSPKETRTGPSEPAWQSAAGRAGGAAGERPEGPPLHGADAALVAALDGGPRHIDELARSTGEPIGEVGRRLTLLELRGRVKHLGGMRWEAR